MTQSNYIDSSWFKLVPNEIGYELFITVNGTDKKLRCASVLNPLYMWAASNLVPYDNDMSTWEELARPAITRSSNQATTLVWDACGRSEILETLTNLTNIPWLEQNAATYWSIVQIDAYKTICAQGDNIVSLHEKVAGQTLRNETKRMLYLALQYKA